jgi:hypothetical protein|tara:strand:+ start:290 stop:742 length:453 start_codon:yes stop_codon:yes gene_type:complete
MAENRTPRDLVSRDKQTRYVYTPSSALPDPTPEPGYVYRWVATHVLGQAEPTNVSRKMRDGWEPVKAEDHPELMIEGSAKTGNVEIGGLMLCKMIAEKARARDDYYDRQAQNQMESVDNHFMRNNDPRMPLFADRKSTVSGGKGFGSGSK